jgi:hypothetical protein
VYFDVIQYISMYLKVFEYLSMYLNVFTNIIIGISPLHSHYNIFAMCTHLYICFSLSTMTPFPTCFTTILFYHIPIDPFLLSYNLWKYYMPIFTQWTYCIQNTLPKYGKSRFGSLCPLGVNHKITCKVVSPKAWLFQNHE